MSQCQASVTKKIITDLLDINLCKFCILRFLNEKNSELYRSIESTFQKLLGESNQNEESSPASKQKKFNPCSACLGLLQLSNDSNFVEEVVKKVQEANYDSDDVTFALSLPITFLIRDYSVWFYVSNKYIDYYLEKSYENDLSKDYNIVSVKEVWKWIMSHKIAKKLSKSVNNGVNGNFHVNIVIEYEKDESETLCLFTMFPELRNRSVQKRKFHGEILTRKNVEHLLTNVDVESFKNNYPVPPKIPDCFVKCSSVECVHDSIFLAGRYNKLSRSLSQTPWVINGERRMETSVEEIIGNPVSKYIKNDGIKFSSSGREDVDVRTLGKGRPFVLDIANPRKIKIDEKTLRLMENEINQSTSDVFIRDLQIVKKEDLSHIKEGEQEKTKTYNCFCIVNVNNDEEVEILKDKLSKLSEIKNLIIQQRTPIRVLHRRPLAVRPKQIFWLEAKFQKNENNQFYFKLRLKVEAGTYIKEFVHGDFGRTSTNLSEILGVEADILALDVEEIDLNWPPQIEYNGVS